MKEDKDQKDLPKTGVGESSPLQWKLTPEEAAYVQPFIEAAIALREQAEARARLARSLALRLTGHPVEAPIVLQQAADGSIWLVVEPEPEMTRLEPMPVK